MNVYAEVLDLRFDEDMSDIRKGILYRLLRYAYAVGHDDGKKESTGGNKLLNI